MKFLFFIFLVPAIAFPQTSSISYECELDTKSINSENGLNKLYFSKEQSLYIFKEWPKESSTKTSGNTVSIITADPEGMPVYTDLKNNKQIYKTTYRCKRNNPWILTEEVPKIEWTISTNKRTFGNLTALFATGVYGGRNYEVWFTPEIPVPLGPHRLNGLPGMILEAKSTDGKVSFTFLSYDPIEEDSVLIVPPTNGVPIEQNTLERYFISILLKTEANSPPQFKDTCIDPNPDFEIERNKWTVFSDYKKKRQLKKGGW